LQEQASKHLKLLWSKAMVVSVEEKVPPDGISCESERRAQANHPMRCRNIRDGVKTGVLAGLQDNLRGNLFTAWAASGIKMA
jgi:hypothetical protein